MKPLLFFLLFLSSIVNPQDSVVIQNRITEFRYSDVASNVEYRIIDYIIDNQTTRPYYTWIDYTIPADTDIKEAAIRYFFSLSHDHGNISFAHILTDNCVFPSGWSPRVGSFFLKKIEPGESFHYLTMKGGHADFDVTNHIFSCREDLLVEIVGTIANISALYDKEFIILSSPCAY